MPNKELFEQYAQLKIKETFIKDEIELLKEGIMAELRDVTEDTVSLSGVGDFIKVRRKNWTYTSIVQEIADRLKVMKAEQEAKGTATFEVAETFMFKAIKIKNK